MKLRIVLSRIVLSTVLVALASCQDVQQGAVADDEPVAATQKAITGDPCGVWIDRTPAMADLRADAFPTRPDGLFFTYGTSTCSEAYWHCATRYLWDTYYQGCTFRYIHAPGTTANGIGTSPSGPVVDGISTSPSDLVGP